MKYICMFLPAFVAADKELTGKEDIFKKIGVYSKYCIFINLLMLLFLVVIGKGSIHFDDMCTVHYYVFYLVISFLLAQVLPKIVLYCRKNFKLKIKRK